MTQVNHYRVLIIDDNPAIHQDFRKVLQPAGESTSALDALEAELFDGPAAGAAAAQDCFEVDAALQGQEGLEKHKASLAEGRPYALAFVDMRMPPGWNGIETIAQLWKVDPHLQVVICSAYSDYSPDEIAQKLGVNRGMLLLRKPFDQLEVRQLATTLAAKWQVNCSHQELESIVQARTAELKKLALHDPLTGLPNRLLFHDRLANALARSRRDPAHKCAVLFIDADEFKVVNDSLGHEAGDQLLLEMAERLRRGVREMDTVSIPDGSPDTPMLAARLGGDEFAILLDPIGDDTDAARVAQRLLQSLGETYDIQGHKVHSSASIGITTSSLGYEKPEDMLRDADTAMYHAKRAGRARLAIFDQDMHVRAMARLTYESDLRQALESDQIHLHYQPIVAMQTDALVGFEALARWTHPQRGQVPPVEFIAMAEETGIIVPLGLKLLRTACQQLTAWQRQWPHLKDLTMSVNVARKQLAAPEFAGLVAQILRESGVSPGNLKLEITESSLMNDARATIDALGRVRSLGVQLHMDDFGSGYSSLSCLQNFPLDGMKIDREFVSGVPDNKSQTSIVKSVIALSRGLNVPLVAEGVENASQKATLQALGCAQAQGYLFGRPMPADMATAFIREHTVPAHSAA